jgi:hypothetical protein
MAFVWESTGEMLALRTIIAHARDPAALTIVAREKLAHYARLDVKLNILVGIKTVQVPSGVADMRPSPESFDLETGLAVAEHDLVSDYRVPAHGLYVQGAIFASSMPGNTFYAVCERTEDGPGRIRLCRKLPPLANPPPPDLLRRLNRGAIADISSDGWMVFEDGRPVLDSFASVKYDNYFLRDDIIKLTAKALGVIDREFFETAT